ncbi:MAG TPA: DUF3631 domain-containing protein [Solirubrobacteraceae bacterium]|nr:DUF3631 domain-containing protein [Solirubrobacteraceae bacterium]
MKKPMMSEREVVDDIGHFIKRYVAMDGDKLLVVSLWTLHTYCFQLFPQTPYLAVNSPEKQCGKTRLLEVLEQVCARPWRTTNPSEAVVYRKINKDKPTLMLDEVDGIFRKGSPYEHLQTLLNAGNRSGTKVPRVLNPQSDALIEYSIWCPKVLAGIGTLPDTIADRSIPIRLERRTRDQRVERFRDKQVNPIAAEVRERIATWAATATMDDEPELPDELSDRQQDCAEPLLAIADAVGYGDQARKALVTLLAEERLDSEESLGVVLLRDLRAWFEARPDLDSAYTSWLLEGLKGMPESPWLAWDFGRPLDDRGLASLLKPYGLKSEVVRADGEKPLRGYKRHKLEHVWKQYATHATADTATQTTAPQHSL